MAFSEFSPQKLLKQNKGSKTLKRGLNKFYMGPEQDPKGFENGSHPIKS